MLAVDGEEDVEADADAWTSDGALRRRDCELERMQKVHTLATRHCLRAPLNASARSTAKQQRQLQHSEQKQLQALAR